MRWTGPIRRALPADLRARAAWPVARGWAAGVEGGGVGFGRLRIAAGRRDEPDAVTQPRNASHYPPAPGPDSPPVAAASARRHRRHP